MKKSAGITKYEIEWQFLRVSLKGRYNNDLLYKLEQARLYFEAVCTYDRWERVVNWLEGLSRGFKAVHNQISIDFIKQEIDWYNANKPPITTTFQSSKTFADYLVKDRLLLWADLLKTNKKWLASGYHHKEAVSFLKELYLSLEDTGAVTLKLQSQYSEFLNLSQSALLQRNNHRFFF